MLDPAIVVVVLIVTFAAVLKGGLGIGFPLIATPVVATLVGVRESVVIMAIPTLASNLIMIGRIGLGDSQARRFVPFIVALIAGTVAGGALLRSLNAAALSIALGLIVLLYVGLRLAHPGFTVSPRLERVVAPIVGAASGLLGGTTNIFSPMFATYLHALKLDPKAFVGSVTLLFTVGNLTQIATYTQLGLYTGERLLYAVAFCIPMVIGIALGMWLQQRLNAVLFDRLVLVVLTLSALNLLYRGLTSG